VGLGMLVLGEQFTAGIAVGFPLIIAGCWLSTRKPAGKVQAQAQASIEAPAADPVCEPAA